jgi:NAD(P)-dependent dehydrogenase (short-subunit alcohol dehydrogenase family)
MSRPESADVVVITGSTRGLGLALADAFLQAGCAVAICGRSQAPVDEALSRLSGYRTTSTAWGQSCDVTKHEQVQALWDAAIERFGKVDIWINNAGLAHPQLNTWDLTPGQIRSVVETNVIGALHGSKVALSGMRRQGFGRLYNVEGLGSDGRWVRGLALYGSTKYSLRYLTDAMVRETRGTGIVVGALRPGMLITGLVTEQYRGRPEAWERDRKIYNILADRAETVAPWLVNRMLTNRRSGARFGWLTRRKLLVRFLLAPFAKPRFT